LQQKSAKPTNEIARRFIGNYQKRFRSAEGATFRYREMAMSALRASGVIENLFHDLTVVAIQWRACGALA